ncbi:MAG TPA: hypothetical protein VHM65_09425 [Candidatus Lustribacter sp.]|nr:hypothetical protein [Candidatus Lustribacter sp.]
MRISLSGVRSLTHLVYAASYVRAVLAESSGPVTVLDLGVGTFLGRATVTESDVARVLPTHERLTVTGPGAAGRTATGPRATSYRHDYLSVGAPGIKPYLRLVARDPRHRPRVVVLDEGLGSYGDWHTRRDAWRRQGGREPWPTLRSWAVSSANQILTDVRWSLFEQAVTGWVVAPRVGAEFQRHTYGQPGRPGRAVFLTQPWVELGLVSASRYVEHLTAVAAVCAEAGLDLQVRAHPAEDRTKYAGIALDPSTGLAELDRSVVSADVVLGGNSTALLNLAAVHERPALRVGLPELAHLDAQLGPRQRSLLDTYLPPVVDHRADLMPGLLRAFGGAQPE